jgi:uncharacterized protein YjiS (DUF1127 family)
MSCGSTTCKSSIFIDTSPPPPRTWSIPSPFELVHRICERRHQRQQLLELDDRLLADIGISRRQAIEEARKSFWK